MAASLTGGRSLPVQPPDVLLDAGERRLSASLHSAAWKARVRNPANVRARPTATATHTSNAVKHLLGWLVPAGIGSKVRLFVTAAAVFFCSVFHVQLEDKRKHLQGKRVQRSQLGESGDSDRRKRFPALTAQSRSRSEHDEDFL